MTFNLLVRGVEVKETQPRDFRLLGSFRFTSDIVVHVNGG